VVTVGPRKPSPEPYLAIADALGVPPEECLFVDDLPVNCRGAEAVGMRSHLFDITNPESSLNRLLDVLG
jgi:putative hydrolase of the HAD superfamily